MKGIILRDIRKFFTGKIMFLLFGCFLCGLAERQYTDLSYEQFILGMISEHYYLTYFMIPVFLLFTHQTLEDDMEYILIRSGFYWKYFSGKVLALFLNMIGFVLIQIAVIMMLGIGLDADNSFLVSSVHSAYGIEELFMEYAKNFNSPVVASIAASMYMVIGLTVISTLFLTMDHFFEKRMVSILMITLYVLMTFGLKIPGLNDIPFLFMNNFIILHYNISLKGKLVMSLVFMLIILVVTGISMKYYWNKRPQWVIKLSKKGIGFYYARYLFTKSNLVIILVGLILVSIWKFVNLSTFPEVTMGDFFLTMFYGHGVNEFKLFNFIEMLILNGLPLYLFSIFMETINNEQNIGLTIRIKHKRNWTRVIMQIAIGFIVLYFGLMIAIGIVLGVAIGLPINGFTLINLPNDSFILFLLQLSALKVLDVLFQFLLFFILFICKRNVTMAFLIVLGTNVMSILPMAWVIYFPTGLSSMARNSLMLGQAGVSFQLGIFILGGCVLLQWAYIKFYGYKKVLGG